MGREFIKTGFCATGAFCPNCRGADAENWYAQWGKDYEMPAGFTVREGERPEETAARRQEECPKKLPMGWSPPVQVTVPPKKKKGGKSGSAAEARAKTLAETWRLEGPKLWAAFVDWAINSRPDESGGWTERRRQFNRLVGSVPCGSCRADFVAMIERTPPPFSHPDNARRLAWVYARHDEVNFKLGRPAFWAIVNVRPSACDSAG